MLSSGAKPARGLLGGCLVSAASIQEGRQGGKQPGHEQPLRRRGPAPAQKPQSQAAPEAHALPRPLQAADGSGARRPSGGGNRHPHRARRGAPGHRQRLHRRQRGTGEPVFRRHAGGRPRAGRRLRHPLLFRHVAGRARGGRYPRRRVQPPAPPQPVFLRDPADRGSPVAADGGYHPDQVGLLLDRIDRAAQPRDADRHRGHDGLHQSAAGGAVAARHSAGGAATGHLRAQGTQPVA